jgi:hypothetical protein
MEKDKEQTPLRRLPDGRVAGIVSMGDMLDDEARTDDDKDDKDDKDE